MPIFLILTHCIVQHFKVTAVNITMRSSEKPLRIGKLSPNFSKV